MKLLSLSRALRTALVAALSLGLLAPCALADDGGDSGSLLSAPADTGMGATATGSAIPDTGYLDFNPADVTTGLPDTSGAGTAAAAGGAALPPIGPSGLAFDSPDAIRNFKLSVGDTFTVNIWGTDLRIGQTFIIPFEGRIYLPQVGEVPVVGLTTAQIRDKIAHLLAQRHPGLHVSVLLVATRPIKVFVTGLVSHPGIVTVPALSRVSAALGGVLPEGSLRHIVIRRDGASKPIVVDLMKFLMKGDVSSDPLLKSGDNINIGPIENRASIEGDVYRPMAYEFLPGETIKDLVFMAQGARPDAALSQASILNDNGWNRADRTAHALDLTKAGAMDRPLQNGDVIDIPTGTMATIALPRTHVTVVGAVAHPGTYTLAIGTRLRDALNMVGGVQPGAGMRQVRIYHKATAGGVKFDQPIIEDAYALLYQNDESQDIQLQDGDLVLVPESKDLASDSAVYVYGQVGKPGKEPYRAGYRLSDYLDEAGGALDKADLRHVSVTRASDNQTFNVDAYQIMREGKFNKDPLLQPGDVVNVPEDFFYVSNFNDLAGLITTVGTLITAGLAVWTVVRSVAPASTTPPVK